MAPVYRAGLGPTFLERDMLDCEGGPVFSECVATTDGDAAAAPVTNCYWVRETSAVTSAQRVYSVGPCTAFVGKTYEHAIIAAHRVEGTLNAAWMDYDKATTFEMDAGDDVYLYIKRVSNTTFQYGVGRGAGAPTDGSARSTSTNFGLRIEFNGTNVTLTVDGSLDITLACTDMPTEWFHRSTGLHASVKQYFCGLVWRGSDDLADRPNTTPTIEGLNPDGDNETADYGDQVDCTTAVGQWQDWDDDGGDDSNTAIYLCEEGGANGTETSELEAVSMATPELVQMRYLGRPSAAGKIVAIQARQHDGTNSSEVALSGMTVTDWRGHSRPFPLAPGGGAWDQGEVNGLKAGVRTVDTNQANDHWAMMRAEVFDLGDDPPPVGPTATRRSGSVQVV